MRFLGVKIHGGYTSEARVFASLLGHRAGRYEARVLYHTTAEDDRGLEAFQRAATCDCIPLDTSMRPNEDGRRSARDKALTLVRFRLSFPRLLRDARIYKPDIIYSSQQMWDTAAATYISRRLGVPHVMHLHYLVGPWLRTGFAGNPRAMERAMKLLGLADPLERLRECYHVIAISDFIRKEALHHGVLPERVTTVRNSQPLLPAQPAGTREAVRRELCILERAPVLGIVGRLDVDKGQEDTLEAFARVAHRFADAVLLIVGSGPQGGALELRAEELGVAGRTRFLGQRADVPRLLAAMDVFMHPSRREPFGLAIAEASSAGLPVIAYAEGGVPEIVVDGETGLLVPPGDQDALADALAELLTDPARAAILGAAGRRRIAEQFRPEDAGIRLADLLGCLVTFRHRA